MRRGAGGFTLIELMVVVVIAGILAAFSISAMKDDPVGDASRKTFSVLNEASRRAMSRGPVRVDVATATGQKARVRLQIVDDGSHTALYLDEVEEDALPAKTFKWITVLETTLPAKAQIYAVTDTAATLPGSTPTALSGTVTKYYYPDGSADAFTVFLARRGATTQSRIRVAVLPLTGIPASYADW